MKPFKFLSAFLLTLFLLTACTDINLPGASEEKEVGSTMDGAEIPAVSETSESDNVMEGEGVMEDLEAMESTGGSELSDSSGAMRELPEIDCDEEGAEGSSECADQPISPTKLHPDEPRGIDCDEEGAEGSPECGTDSTPPREIEMSEEPESLEYSPPVEPVEEEVPEDILPQN